MPKTDTRATATIHQVTIRSRWQPPPGQPNVQLYDISSAGRTHCKLMVDQHEIPYLDVVDITDQWEGYVSDPNDDSPTAQEAARLRGATENGERILNLLLDNRYGYTVTEADLHRWAWFLANAMAVSAGYTSHGQNSRRINRHGVSL